MRLQPGKIRASHQHFNPRTRTGCDQVVLHGFRRQNISIHAPARGATHLPSSLAYIATFQSTHPHGVRLWRMDDSDVPADFNPRTRTGCDSTRRGESQGSSVFQSTHPHGVRLRIRELETGIVDISIHAPARGATIILRPPYRRCRYFNPRTRTGCDLVLAENTTTGNLISIHAPARGATHGVSLDLLPCRFQSTHPHGVRPMSASSWSSSSVFQSTHPHGVRLSDAREWDRDTKFQSTHPHGVRLCEEDWGTGLNLFQSTHPHGVRHRTWRLNRHPEYFNPRTRTGCDLHTGGA